MIHRQALPTQHQPTHYIVPVIVTARISIYCYISHITAWLTLDKNVIKRYVWGYLASVVALTEGPDSTEG